MIANQATAIRSIRTPPPSIYGDLTNNLRYAFHLFCLLIVIDYWTFINWTSLIGKWDNYISIFIPYNVQLMKKRVKTNLQLADWFGALMVLNATFNNISIISWRSVLLEETGVPWENHWPVESHWQTLSHNVASSTFFFVHLATNRVRN